MAHSDIEYPGWRFRLWPRRREPSPESLLPALAPYHSLSRHRMRKLFGISATMLFCFIWGFFFSIYAPSNFVFLVSPLIFCAFLVIWALPDTSWAPTRALEWLFFATLIVLIGWPDYLAIALPGLPWITMLRLTSFPLALTLLICISMSVNFRTNLVRSLKGVPAVPILLGIFAFIQLYSVALSHDISSSIQKFIVAQTTWTAVFFAASYILVSPGQVKRWAIILWALAIYVSLIAIWEYRIGHLPWSGHIPGLLKIEDESVQRILAGSMRAGTDRYRAQATFGTPLGLAEFNALVLPFILHFSTGRFSQKLRMVAWCSIPLVIYADYLTDAKLGTIGCLAAVVIYVFATALRNVLRNKSSLLAASVLYSFPVGLLTLLGAMLASPRLKVIIFGGSSHSASTDARVAQYTAGIQKFLEWPFGYGIGQGAATLGFSSEEHGMITIDTYYLSILLEYGIAGFIVYYGMFAIAIYEGIRRSLLIHSENEDKSFLLPITVSLICFIIIKSVFSQQDNHPVVFMMLGALVALVSTYKKTSATAQSKKNHNKRVRSPSSWQAAAAIGRTPQ